MAGALTDIPGVRVGHATDPEKRTGCTVVLFDQGGVTGGVDRRGQATSTRQIDALDPTHLGREVHAFYLTGGSAFGLDSAAGVMRYLEEKETGLNVPWGVVPSVPTAVIFDLAIGDHRARPTPEMAEAACRAATGDGVECGSVGAGDRRKRGQADGDRPGDEGRRGDGLSDLRRRAGRRRAGGGQRLRRRGRLEDRRDPGRGADLGDGAGAGRLVRRSLPPRADAGRRVRLGVEHRAGGRGVQRETG